MRVAITRCANCGVQYTWQASGNAAPPPYNDRTWCPNCKKAVEGALKKIPRTLEGRWRDIAELPAYKEVGIDLVLSWERAQTIQNASRSFIDRQLQRVWPGRINITDGDTEHIREIRGLTGPEHVRGRSFRVTTWTKQPVFRIEVEMEWDLINQHWTGKTWG